MILPNGKNWWHLFEIKWCLFDEKWPRISENRYYTDERPGPDTSRKSINIQGFGKKFL